VTQPDFPNPVDHPVIDAIRARWSPYRYAARTVEDDKLIRCLEAARWAASSFNDQPWSWIVAKREDTAAFATALGCLVEANQAWAQDAGVLILTCIRTDFAKTGKPNRVALHDLGIAACQLSLQAATLGLQVHQMAGVDLDAVRRRYELPTGVEPQTAIAIGYANEEPPRGDFQIELEQRQNGPRTRKSLSDQVFTGKFGSTAGFVA